MVTVRQGAHSERERALPFRHMRRRARQLFVHNVHMYIHMEEHKHVNRYFVCAYMFICADVCTKCPTNIEPSVEKYPTDDGSARFALRRSVTTKAAACVCSPYFSSTTPLPATAPSEPCELIKHDQHAGASHECAMMRIGVGALQTCGANVLFLRHIYRHRQHT